MRAKKTRLPEISGELAENILDLIDREGFTSFREMLTVLNFKLRTGEMSFAATPSISQYRSETNRALVLRSEYDAQYLNGNVAERFEDDEDEDTFG